MIDPNWKEMADLEIMGDLLDECVDMLRDEEKWADFEAPELTEEDLDDWFEAEYSEEN